MLPLLSSKYTQRSEKHSQANSKRWCYIIPKVSFSHCCCNPPWVSIHFVTFCMHHGSYTLHLNSCLWHELWFNRSEHCCKTTLKRLPRLLLFCCRWLPNYWTQAFLCIVWYLLPPHSALFSSIDKLTKSEEFWSHTFIEPIN